MLDRDAIIGCLVGGAFGDAIGRPYEGLPAPVEVELEDCLEISDDTQLTLATCEGIIEAGGIDPERIAASFTSWFRAGRISGIGSSTLKAMRDLDAGAH